MNPDTQIRGNGSGRRSNERPLSDITLNATPARSCRCETPWLYTEEDGTFHCANCGRDWRVRRS